MKQQLMVGLCSEFGGPHDTGMKPDEGVSVYANGSDDPYKLFTHPTRRLGHDLNPESMYCAMRWNSGVRTHAQLVALDVRVKNPITGAEVQVHPADWGPAEWTGRIIDLSPGALKAIGCTTDDRVSVCILG